MVGVMIGSIRNWIKRILLISKSKYGDILFYVVFSVIYLYRFYTTSMFPNLLGHPWWLKGPSYLAIMTLAGLSVLSFLDAVKDGSTTEQGKSETGVNDSSRDAILIAFMLIGTFISLLVGKWRDPFVPCCFVGAARKRNLRPVLILSVVIGSIVLILSYSASMSGYIPYLVYGSKGGLSHAFGMVYRTDLAAHVLYLVMIYAILRGWKLRLWEYLMLWIDTLIVWRYTAARTDTVCLAAFLSVLGLMLVWRKIKVARTKSLTTEAPLTTACIPRASVWRRSLTTEADEVENGETLKIPGWTSLIHPACAIVVFTVIAVFSLKHGEVKASSSGASSSDTSGSYTIERRIQLSVDGFRNYPVNLFGYDIEEMGAGGIPDTSKPFFYLDISYVRFLLKGGLVVLVVYLILMMRASRYAAKHNAVLALALVVVAMESMIEQHGFGLAYNVLIGFGMGEMVRDSDLVAAS